MIDNELNANDVGNNNWNSSQIGNYWSNYTGPDLDDNGIGDVPYNYSGVVDYLPIRYDGDDILPNITIHSPTPGVYLTTLPLINVTATDASSIDAVWYVNGSNTFLLNKID